MDWLAILLALLGLAAGFALARWRYWSRPWHELSELVTALSENREPRKFLMTGNPSANRLGLALEKLAAQQRELKLTASEATHHLHNLLGALPDGLALVDRERRLQMSNPRFRALFGQRQERPGAGLLELVRSAEVDRAVKRALEAGETQTETMALRGPEDAQTVLDITAVPFTSDEAQGLRHVLILFRDVTEVQRVEEMRRDFVANVSHELRTPLSIFRGYLEGLLDDPAQPREELVRILEVMDRHAERLTLLVEDILSLARLETPGARLERTEIYLPDFLAGILRDWQTRFEAKLLRAALDLPPDLPVIAADEPRLQEVIDNLLDNALKYSHPEGQVRLAARREAETVRISVADDGVGIPARDLPRIFERFYRADKARSRQVGGTGLGLSIVKHIAQLHGGRVEAASEPGRGATISVILPIRPPEELEEIGDSAQPQFTF